MSKKQNIDKFTLEVVANAHRRWIKDNQSATLRELYYYLLSVETEFDRHDDDERIIDHIDGFNKEAAHYVRQFDELEFDCGIPVTIEYRLENLIEDIGHVQKLITEAGTGHPIEKLVPLARLDELPAE